MTVSRRDPWLWALALLALTLAALASRPLLPLDETRYMAVAWEMWSRGDFLVPFKNGEAYSHKPPLLFWLIHAGWALFGINEWWPRLIPPLLSLASLWLTWRIAHRLWPREPQVASLAGWVLLSSLLWLLYSQGLMFDILVTVCALLSLWALVELSQGGAGRWWLLYALGLGLGLLAKGPAVLLHVLPVALLAPLWRRPGMPAWGRWYAGVLGGLLAGVALVLAWAIPAALSGGPEYRDAIFWGQTANRVVKSFAHQRPFWWYLATLPLFFFPWLLWPRAWRAIRGLGRAAGQEPGLRLVLIWFVAAFVAFSFISGKQPHYLMPEFPALALLFGLALGRAEAGPGRPWLPALLLLAAGLALQALPQLAGDGVNRRLTELAPAWIGLGPLLLGAWLLHQALEPAAAVRRLAWASLAVFIWLLLVVIQPIRGHYDLHPLARAIAQVQAAGHPVAHEGKYHAQYHFFGRLTAPLREMPEAALADWLERTPGGRAVLYVPAYTDLASFRPLAWQNFRTGHVLLVDQAALPRLRQDAAKASRVIKDEAEDD